MDAAGQQGATPLPDLRPDGAALDAASDDAPTATATPPPTSTPVATDGAGAIYGYATAYGVSYQGQPLGCSGAGVYDTANPAIAAVGPAHYAEWPCGTELRICGDGGCAVVTRVDSCPGCSYNVVDLSEAANELVCGAPAHTCRARIEELR